MSGNPKTCYSVVTVDDSEDDRFFLRLAVGRFPRFKLLHELSDGTEAIEYLAGQGRFSEGQKYPLPDLLLLDLKMPRQNGHDVLRWLQTQSFPSLTVAVLSGSILPSDVESSLSLGAHGYWAKTTETEKQQVMVLEMQALLDERSALFAKTQIINA